MRMVDREIDNARSGHLAWMMVKLNNLVDRRIIKKLYMASATGVHVDVIVRGICVLIPGVPVHDHRIQADLREMLRIQLADKEQKSK